MNSSELKSLIENTVLGLGYTLVRIEVRGEPKGKTLAVYLDKPGGITIGDCARASRQLTRVLTVEFKEFGTNYHLEVSSPGSLTK